jgi:hypothetical protein
VVLLSADDEGPSLAPLSPPARSSTYDDRAIRPPKRSNSRMIPHSDGSNWLTSLRQPVPFLRRQSIGGDGLHEQNESFPNPRPSRALTDLGKLHVQCQLAPSFNAMLI